MESRQKFYLVPHSQRLIDLLWSRLARPWGPGDAVLGRGLEAVVAYAEIAELCRTHHYTPVYDDPKQREVSKCIYPVEASKIMPRRM